MPASLRLRGVNQAQLARAAASAQLDSKASQWVDQVSEISSLLARYRYYMGWVVLVSYVAVFGLLYPRYRRASWRVVGAHRAGELSVTLALLGIAGQGLQLFHLLALMLLLGIGVDYGIFLQEPGSQRRRHGLACRRLLGVEHAFVLRFARFEPDAGVARVRPDDGDRYWRGGADRTLLSQAWNGEAAIKPKRNFAKTQQTRFQGFEELMRWRREI